MKITQEMIEYFTLRTRAHLYLVNKYHNKIAKLKDNHIDLFNKERDEHDNSKWSEPELEPYICITWDYYCKRKKISLEIN